MADFNKVILMGRLTRDPELREVGTSVVCEAGIATNRKFKKKDGTPVEEKFFGDLVIWGKGGEVFEKFMSKGSPVHIEGYLKLDQWGEGENKRSKVRIVVDNFQFLSANESKKEQPSRDGGEDLGGF